MADSAIFVPTARGEVKIATDLVNDPDFGPVHLFRVAGGGGAPSGEVDVSDRDARLLGHVTVDNYAQFPGGGGSGGGLTLAELVGEFPLPVAESAFPASFAVSNFPASFGSVQSGAWTVGINNWPATQPVSLASVPTHGVTGPLTNAELRAAAVPVSGTFWQATQPVSGTFWQATQPVSLASVPSHAVTGPLTNAELRAAAVPVSMGAESVLFKGRANTFNIPGRAGTTGQKILSIWNAGSNVKVYVNKAIVDLAQTVVKAVTVAPFPIRMYKVVVAPTNGTVATKNKIGGTTTSHADVTVRGDASADNTGSATTLTATLPAGAIITQEFAPRLITAAGYEMADRIEFFQDSVVELLSGEGLVMHLEYTLATQNPTTDRWIAGIEWSEKAP